MAKGLNEVGAVWNKKNDKGEYLSISLDLDALLELMGGVLSGKVDLNAYPIPFEKTNARAPDYRLKCYPKMSATPVPRAPSTVRRAPAPPLDDDDIPF